VLHESKHSDKINQLKERQSSLTGRARHET